MPRVFNRSAALALAAGALALPAHAGIGDPLYAATNGHIIVTFAGSAAGYDSVLSVNGSPEFFPNHATAVGATYDLGSFTAGQAIDIVLHVVTTGDFFHSGPASGNPDGVAHANVIYDYSGTPGLTYVGFEDLFGGGDRDYDDLNFTFTNLAPTPVGAVPEPETYALLLAGLAALGARARRQQRSKR
jgi:hypothetical protein